MSDDTFIANVVPWPSSKDEPGYINVHWLWPVPDNPAKTVWVGKPVRTVEEFKNVVTWAQSQQNVTDIYYCLSLQSKTGAINKRGNPKALRRQENALLLNAIWLDVDVKEGKGYATLIEALDAITAFVNHYGIPKPSALVGSGGGVHVYWISDRPLTPTEWMPYAQGLKNAGLSFGLKFDAGVTTDSARVLRVPGTANYKTNPPKPVKLLGLGGRYDFTASLAMLPTTPAHVVAGATPAPKLSALGSAFAAGPAAAFKGLSTEKLSDGLSSHITAPLDMGPVVQGCAFIREAIVTGGKDYSQPMWNLSTLAATFLEHGNALAHKMGNKHPEYTPESTEALWDRKTSERADRNLGWPSCSSIQDAGCGSCATCPHFGKIKSPLSLTKPVTPASTALTATVTAPVDPLCLPDGYTLNADGLISKVVVYESKDKEQPPVEEIEPLFSCKITQPAATYTNGVRHLTFFVTTDLGRAPTQVAIPLKVLASHELPATLANLCVIYKTKMKRYLEEFFMAWITRLHDAMAAQENPPFGWHHYDHTTEVNIGFCFGGFVFEANNVKRSIAFVDRTVEHKYKPQGGIQPWFDAHQMVVNMKSGAHQVAMAVAFACPLVIYTGHAGAMCIFYGEPGGGKSSAMKIGAAGWGNPKTTVEVINATQKAVLNRTGQIKNLPVYWDEIKDAYAQKHVFDTAFILAQGQEGARLNRDSTQKDQGQWCTMLACASNLSFAEFIVSQQKSTSAGLYRILQFTVPKLAPGSPGVINRIDADLIMDRLHYNYGNMGVLYAAFLANDPVGAKARTIAHLRRFEKLVSIDENSRQEERFWGTICGTIMAGAENANQLGCAFDLQLIEDYLVVSYHENRKFLTEAGTEGGTTSNTADHLAAFLKYCSGNTVWVNQTFGSRGRPQSVTVLHPQDIRNSWRPMHVQFSVDDRLCRISRSALSEYLKQKEVAISPFLSGLKQHYGSRDVNATIGRGTFYAKSSERCIELDVAPGSSLWGGLSAHVKLSEQPFVPEAEADAMGLMQTGLATAMKDLQTVRDATAGVK